MAVFKIGREDTAAKQNGMSRLSLWEVALENTNVICLRVDDGNIIGKAHTQNAVCALCYKDKQKDFGLPFSCVREQSVVLSL